MVKLLALLFLVSGCVAIKEPAFRTSSAASSGNMAPSRWSSAKFPLKVRISDDFSANEDQAIRDMANAWSDSVANKAQFMDANYYTFEKNTTDLNAYEDGVIGVYKMSSWPAQLPLTALAVTQIIGIRKNIGRANEYIEIEHADILINYEVFSFTTDYTWGYDLPTILLHEMGHMLGLYHDHSSVDDSVMYPAITRYVDNRFPKERDIQNLESKYGVSRTVSPQRNLASASSKYQGEYQDFTETAEEERVIIQFEIMADGSENSFINPFPKMLE